MCEVPGELTGFGIQRKCRVRIQRRAGARLSAGSQPRLRLSGSPVGQIHHRIVTAGNPRFGSGAEKIRKIVPGISTGLAIPRDRVEPPHFFSRRGVIRTDETLFLSICRAGAEPLNGLALDDKRSAGGGVFALGSVTDDGLPNGLAVSSIDADKMGVIRREDDLVVIDGDPTHRRRRSTRSVIVLPYQVAGARIERLQRISRVIYIEHAVMNDGCRSVTICGSILHRPGPLKTEVLYVVASDLVQRTVVRGVIVVPDHQPVVWIRI